MASNNFKLFDENKKNMQTDTEYNADSQRLQGVQSGVASSKLNNKFAYQVSLVAYAIAQLMNANGVNANDTDAVSTFVNNLSSSVVQKVVDKATTSQAQAGTDNTKWVTPAHIKAAIQYYTNGSGSNVVNVRHGGTGLTSVPNNQFLVGTGSTSLKSWDGATLASYLGIDTIQDELYPVGTIVNSVDPNFPDTMKGTWLPCDGRAIDKYEYPELWKKVKNGPTNQIVPFTNIKGYNTNWKLYITGGKKINGVYYLLGKCENFLGSSSIDGFSYPVVIYHDADGDLTDDWDIIGLDIPNYTSLQSSATPEVYVYDICYNESIKSFLIVGALPLYESGYARYSTMAYWYGTSINAMERRSDQNTYLNAYTNYVSSCVAVDDYFVASFIYSSVTYIYKMVFGSTGGATLTKISYYSDSLGFISLFYSNNVLYYTYKGGTVYTVCSIKKSDFGSSDTYTVKSNTISDKNCICVVKSEEGFLSVITSYYSTSAYAYDGFSKLYSFVYKNSDDTHLSENVGNCDIGILNGFYGSVYYNKSQDYLLSSSGIYTASRNPSYVGQINIHEKTILYISEEVGSNYIFTNLYSMFSDLLFINASSKSSVLNAPVFLSLVKALPIKQGYYIKAEL